MKGPDVKHLKDLKADNQKLKIMVAELNLGKVMGKKVFTIGNF